MNGKKAKRLRRQAEAKTIRMPAKNYNNFRFGLHPPQNPCQLTENCTRKRYKELKCAA